MLSTALWILEQEYKFVKNHFTYIDPNPDKIDYWELGTAAALITGATLQTSVFTYQPYYRIWQASAALDWAVRDTTWTRLVKKTGAFGGKYNTYTLHNFYPRLGAFAQRGGWRFAATKIGSRAVPVLGWALLTYDLWKVGKWLGQWSYDRGARPTDSGP